MSLFGYTLVKQAEINRLLSRAINAEKECKKLESELVFEQERNAPAIYIEKTDEAKQEIEKLKAEMQEYKKKYLDELQLRLELAKMVDEMQGG